MTYFLRVGKGMGADNGQSPTNNLHKYWCQRLAPPMRAHFHP